MSRGFAEPFHADSIPRRTEQPTYGRIGREAAPSSSGSTEVSRNVPGDLVVRIKLTSEYFVDRKAVATIDEQTLQHVRDIVNWGLIDFMT